MNEDFWQWVANRKATDTIRGDFIRDTRELLKMGINPSTKYSQMDKEAQIEYHKLKKQFIKNSKRK